VSPTGRKTYIQPQHIVDKAYKNSFGEPNKEDHGPGFQNAEWRKLYLENKALKQENQRLRYR